MVAIEGTSILPSGNFFTPLQSISAADVSGNVGLRTLISGFTAGGVTLDLGYSLDGGATWTDVPNGTDFSGFTGTFAAGRGPIATPEPSLGWALGLAALRFARLSSQTATMGRRRR